MFFIIDINIKKNWVGCFVDDNIICDNLIILREGILLVFVIKKKRRLKF